MGFQSSGYFKTFVVCCFVMMLDLHIFVESLLGCWGVAACFFVTWYDSVVFVFFSLWVVELCLYCFVAATSNYYHLVDSVTLRLWLWIFVFVRFLLHWRVVNFPSHRCVVGSLNYNFLCVCGIIFASLIHLSVLGWAVALLIYQLYPLVVYFQCTATKVGTLPII